MGETQRKELTFEVRRAASRRASNSSHYINKWATEKKSCRVWGKVGVIRLRVTDDLQIHPAHVDDLPRLISRRRRPISPDKDKRPFVNSFK